MQILTKEIQHQLRLAWLKNAMHEPCLSDYDKNFLQLQFAIAAAQSSDKTFDALGQVFSSLNDLSTNSQQPLLFGLVYLVMSISDLRVARQEQQLVRKAFLSERRCFSTGPNRPSPA